VQWITVFKSWTPWDRSLRFKYRSTAALAAGFTEDAVFVGGGVPGPHSGRQAIEQRIALDMASSPGELSESHELLQVYELGIDVCAISKFTVGQWKGYAVFLFVRETDGWKIRMEYAANMVE